MCRRRQTQVRIVAVRTDASGDQPSAVCCLTEGLPLSRLRSSLVRCRHRLAEGQVEPGSPLAITELGVFTALMQRRKRKL